MRGLRNPFNSIRPKGKNKRPRPFFVVLVSRGTNLTQLREPSSMCPAETVEW